MTKTVTLLRGAIAATASLTLFVGCAQPPTTSAPRSASNPSASQAVVAPTALTGINDAGKQSTAAALSTGLGAALRANSTMLDASLMTSSTAAFRVLSDGERAGATASASTSASAGTSTAAGPRPSAAPDRDDDRARSQGDDHKSQQGLDHGQAKGADHGEAKDDDQDQAKRHAREGHAKLSKDDKKRVEARIEEHLAKLKSKLAERLARKAKHFARACADQVAARTDGGKDVTSSFTVDGGARTVTVTRSLDADGNLTETNQHLTGTANGVTYDATRTSVVNADGTTTVTRDVKVTVGGKTSETKTTHQVGTDGSETGSGTLTTADGKTATLTTSGTEGGQQTVQATDTTSGVSVKLATDGTSGTATASVDAGSAGKASVPVAADDEDEDGQGDEHKSEEGRENGHPKCDASTTPGGAASGTVAPTAGASGTVSASK